MRSPDLDGIMHGGSGDDDRVSAARHRLDHLDPRAPVPTGERLIVDPPWQALSREDHGLGAKTVRISPATIPA